MKYRLQRVDLRNFLEHEAPLHRLPPDLATEVALALSERRDLRPVTARVARVLLAAGILRRAGQLRDGTRAIPVYALPGSDRVYDLRALLESSVPAPPPEDTPPPLQPARTSPSANGEAFASLEAIRSTLRRDWVTQGLEATLDGLLGELRGHLADPGLRFVLWRERFEFPLGDTDLTESASETDAAFLPLLRALTRGGDRGVPWEGRQWFGVWARQRILGAVGTAPDVAPTLGSEASAVFGDLLAAYLRSQERVFRDPLTGANNRGWFDHQLPIELERSRRASSPLALVFADLDYFKRINDTYGHASGDEALKHAAELFESGLRRIDSVFRWGGEEFALLLPATDSTEALNTAERVRHLLESSPLVLPEGDTVQITASFGVAVFPDHAPDEKSLVRHADAALYEAKNSGRNSVCLHQV